MAKIIQKIKQSLANFSNSRFLTPFFFSVIILLSYCLFINRLGFYWDDWPYLYLNHSQGIGGYPEYMAPDRPFSAWLFMLIGCLFKEKAIGYHIFILLLRLTSALALWWVCNLLWPQRKAASLIPVSLFMIYPGFKQQPISVIYSLHFSVLTSFLCSLGLMLFSIRKPRFYLPATILGLICSLSIFSCEYFAMLELLRPLLIIIILTKSRIVRKKVVSKGFRLWLPYLIVFIVFLIWRVLIFKFPTYQLKIDQILLSINTNGFSTVLVKILRDLWISIILAWIKIFAPFNMFNFNGSINTLWLIITISMGIISFFYFLTKKNQRNKFQENKQMIFLGICAIFLAFIPIWFTGLSIELDFPQDRLTLPISLGSAFLTTGIIKTIIRNNVINNLIFCLLIGFSTGFHFLNTISYIKDWELFNSFFWQLKWRAPMIKQGTTILSDNFPLKYYSDNSLTAPLNWIYDSSNHSKDLNYMFYFLEVRLGRRLPALEKGLTINQPFRSFSFTGSTSDMLILFFNPPACMHIIDNEIDFLYPKIPLTLKKAIPLSKPEVILPEAEITLPSVFIKEPRHDWCYYYQRAELARQNKDWEEIKYLDQAAKEFNEKPEETIELSPFIEAYANLSEWQTAIQYSKFIHQDSPKSDQFQCKLWKRIIENKSPGEVPEEVTRLFFADLGCR